MAFFLVLVLVGTLILVLAAARWALRQPTRRRIVAA